MKQQWIDGAFTILNNITTLAWKPSWQSLLSNGTVNWPADNFLTGIVYGDYYFIRAGNQLVTMGLASCDTPLISNTTPVSTTPVSSARRLSVLF
jgi:hypothetical protein